jgi:hypothetical protein
VDETLRIAPSMVAHAPRYAYIVVQIDTRELPSRDRVGDAIPHEIVEGLFVRPWGIRR